MTAVGFDIGNDNSLIAISKQRNIEILLNNESNRETPSTISFGPNQRFTGSTGSTGPPSATISQIKRLIARRFDHPDVQQDLRRLPFATSEATDGGILIHVRHMNRDRVFSPVQILAMLLSYLKQTVEKNIQSPVTDCVIGIPSYFTDSQRRAYLNAASVSGLKPLMLMHDTAATALAYGIYKDDFSRFKEMVNIAFVDIGHCDTQVSVVEFEFGRMRVVSHASDPNLGGRDFDEVLFDYFARRFKEEYEIDVSCSARACVRLRSCCEKLKRVLSANAEAPMSIECLMEEKDVKGFIRREEFERLSSSLIERVLEPCKKALIEAGLEVDGIHSVELVGSGSRIPAISRVLSGFFRRELSRSLNASECVSRGCALQCAMLSPVFRVRDYEVQDSFPFSIGFSSEDGPISTLSSSILFRKGQCFPSVKMLTFHRPNTFHLDAFYADQNELPVGTSTEISRFKIGPFQVPQSDIAKLKVKIRLNLHGIVFVESAALIEDDINVPRDTSHTDFDNAKPEATTRAFTENGAAVRTNHHDKTNVNKHSRRHEVPVSEIMHGGMSKADLAEAQEQEKLLSYQDKVIEQTKDRKNALEAYVYEVRNKLFERYKSFATEEEKEDISRTLQQTEEWLYEDGVDETEKVYTAKLDELTKLVDPIENRCKDEEARAQASEDLLNRIAKHRMAVKLLGTSERDEIINECNKAEQWLWDKSQLQDGFPKNADPILWSYDINKTTEALDMTCRNILRRSKGSQ